MQCHVCGTEVRPEQKFCMECGARLHHHRDDALAPPELESGPTAPVPALPPASSSGSASHPMFDPITGQLLAQPSAPPEPAEPPAAPDEDATNVLPAIGQPEGGFGDDTFAPPDPYAQGPGHWERAPGGYATPWPEPRSYDDQRDLPTSVQVSQPSYGAPPAHPGQGHPGRPYPAKASPAEAFPAEHYGRYDATGVLPETYAPWEGEWDDVEEPPTYGPTFRIRPLLILSLLPAIAAFIAMFVQLIDIAPDGDLPFGASKLNDFGTNHTVTGIVIVVTMLLGALAWCGGFRWGAGLAGGAGAGLAGWVALVIGLAELRISQAEAAGAADVTRDTGYWSLVAAGGLGMLVLLTSLLRAGNDRRAGLDPWVAALGAIATIAAVLGPLIPLNGANLDLNWSSPAGSDLPTLFFVGRFVQLGLLLVCGVFGFLLVRRYGLGLAIGGTVGIGWMVLTSAAEQTDAPIGPAVLNPGQDQRAIFGGIPIAEPYIVTVVGVGMMLFFGLVAAVMALIDAD